MSQLKTSPFRLIFLAVALLSLGACSATSSNSGFDFGGIGTGLSKIGNKTAQLGSNAWEGTKNVLNIGTVESQGLDEVDLALMEDDAEMQDDTQTGVAQPAVGQVQLAATEAPTPVLARNTLKPNTASEENAPAIGQVSSQSTKLLPANTAEATNDNDRVLAMRGTNELAQPSPAQTNAASQQLPVANADSGSVPLFDVTYEVSASENLWQIAKTTTGDANNWHVIADINNLGPNASVFAGQKLTIPADLVIPEYNSEDKSVISDTAAVKPVQPVTTASAQASVVQTASSSKSATPTVETAAVTLKLPEPNPEPAVAAPESVAARVESNASAAATTTDGSINMDDALALEVGTGETLWDFAKRTTGDATNWKTIAIHNKFDEQNIGLIRAGQKVLVPIDIVRARDSNGTLIPKGEEKLVPDAMFGGVAPSNEPAIAATAAVLAGTNQPAETPSTDAPAVQAATEKSITAKPESRDDDIKIVEAAFQNEVGIKPESTDSLSEEASMAINSDDKNLSKVMVKGTYYPKAVYNSADFSSSLLMRVSPGTQLLVSKAIGPWLEVKTDKGVGYVHSRDIK